jgi:hypothetical protein
MLEMKNIGKPYAGEPLVRFDEGRLCKLLFINDLRCLLLYLPFTFVVRGAILTI